MSSESMGLQEQLAEIQEQHRRQHLSSKLDEVADTMEKTLLQRALAKAFFGEYIELDAGTRTAVEHTMTLLRQSDYEATEEGLDTLERDVETAGTSVENRIQELRIKHNSTVTAMRRLNTRVNRVSGNRLEALEELLGDWKWQEHVYSKGETDPAVLMDNAHAYGEEMAETFEQLKEELFGAYPEEIRGLIHHMIDKERLSYADLSDDQRQLLAESDVGEQIELTLS